MKECHWLHKSNSQFTSPWFSTLERPHTHLVPSFYFTRQKTKAQGGQMTSPGPCLLTADSCSPATLHFPWFWQVAIAPRNRGGQVTSVDKQPPERRQWTPSRILVAYTSSTFSVQRKVYIDISRSLEETDSAIKVILSTSVSKYSHPYRNQVGINNRCFERITTCICTGPYKNLFQANRKGIYYFT